MTKFKKTKATLTVFLAGQLMMATSVSTVAHASMVTTQDAIQRYESKANRQFLMDEIQKQEVRDQMTELGVDPVEAEARLAALSDEEIVSILSQYDADAAGGNGIVGALLTVFIILLVTDLLCLTKAFNFTRCA